MKLLRKPEDYIKINNYGSGYENKYDKRVYDYIEEKLLYDFIMKEFEYLFIPEHSTKRFIMSTMLKKIKEEYGHREKLKLIRALPLKGGLSFSFMDRIVERRERWLNQHTRRINI